MKEYTIQSRGRITRDITNIGRFDNIDEARHYLNALDEAHTTRDHKIRMRECGNWEDFRDEAKHGH